LRKRQGPIDDMTEHFEANTRLSRRMLMAGLGGVMLASRALAAGHEAAPGVAPATALKRLMDGNARYVAGKPLRPNQGAQRRSSLAGGQNPFATILACADSRVSPELLFDQGLGDLFVVRVAGNVVDDVVLASIEYSVIHLGSELVMVLGHERCGAVGATVDALAGKESDADKGTKIGELAGLITPAVREVPANAPDKVDAAVLLNARRNAGLVLKSPPLAERARAGRLEVVSARYDLDTGAVTHVAKA
jgi:carbonic anhydrase